MKNPSTYEVDAEKRLGRLIDMGMSRAALAASISHIVTCLKNGGTVFTCGNGGSAAESDHGVGEALGTFRRRDRKPLRWFDLTAHKATIMAIANDFGFEKIFVRQLEAFAKPGDVLIGFSTSGASENVLAAMRWAQPKKLVTIAMTGLDGAPIHEFSNVCLRAPFKNKTPERDTDFIQEVHLAIVHYWFAELDTIDW